MAKNDTKSKASEEKDESAKGAASGQNDDNTPADGVEGPGEVNVGGSGVLSDPDETAQVAQEYDKATEERLQAQEDDKEEISEGIVRRQGNVLVEPRASRGDLGVGTNTTYPGISTRLGTTDAAVALRRAKSLPETGIIAETANSWTAQSASGFTPSNATQVAGQTVTSEELPDPNSVANSNLPAFSIPAGLVVDPPDARPLIEDSLNSSQQGGDLGTAPKRNRTGPADPPPPGP